MIKQIILSLLALQMLVSVNVFAKNDSIFEISVNKPINEVYKNMSASFDDSRFFVVKELNIGENISGFADRWDNYNQNKLTGFRSMVFCNGWFANKISNQDPSMLAFCPMHITLIEKDGKTTTSFVRPTFIAQQSPALETFKVIEERVISIIKRGMK